jgi:hypothetical protein
MVVHTYILRYFMVHVTYVFFFISSSSFFLLSLSLSLCPWLTSYSELDSPVCHLAMYHIP